MKLKVTKQDKEDADRILGPLARAGRPPTNEEMLEVCVLKMLRDKIAEGTISVAALLAQFGGSDREQAIRKGAKVLAFHVAQIQVFDLDSQPYMTVPEPLREILTKLRLPRRQQ